MAYTITLTSAAQKVNDTDTMQMILVFTVEASGTNQAYTFAEKGIRVADWGEKDLAYDLEEALLVPAMYNCTLTDADEYLLGLFYGTDAEGLAALKNPTLELKKNGDGEYMGVVQEDGVDYNKGNREVQLSIDPNTSILNKTKLFDESGAPLNPLKFDAYNLMPLKDAILKAYQLVNPGITLNISHDWLFTGVKISSPNNVLDDITFEELKVFAQNLVFRQYSDVNTVGDFLRKLALDFCSFTGVDSYGSAFFNKLFCYDGSNLQTMGLKLSHKLRYWYQLIDYVYVKLDIPSVVTWEYKQGKENIFVDEGKLKRQLFTGFRMTEDYTHLPFPGHQTQIQGFLSRGGATDGTYEIYAVKDAALDDTWRDNGDLVARFWYNYRNKMPRMRIDSFAFAGIGYTFLKNFNLEGGKYQIIKMKKLYAKNTTEIDAIHLGVL